MRLERFGTYNTNVSQIVFEVRDSLDGGYEAQALGYRIFTQGEDWADLRAMVADAVRAYFEPADTPSMTSLIGIGPAAHS